MTDLDLASAIEAVARNRAERWGFLGTLDPEEFAKLVRDFAGNGNVRADLECAAPILRAQVAEEIALAIEEFADNIESPEDWEDAINACKDAARIARERKS